MRSHPGEPVDVSGILWTPPGLRPMPRPTFLWRTAGQRGEGEVHDVTADDGGLEEA